MSPVPSPKQISDEAWLERSEKRARAVVRNPTARPHLAASYVQSLLTELDRLRVQRDAVLAALEELDESGRQAERDSNSPKLMGYELHQASGEASAYAYAAEQVRRALGVTS